MYCRNCTNDSEENYKICPNCGIDINHINQSEERSPKTAASISLLVPGLGQAYNHEIYKAIYFFSIIWTLVIMTILSLGALVSYPKMWKFAFVIIIITIVFWIYNVHDAYMGAKDSVKMLAKENIDDGPLS